MPYNLLEKEDMAVKQAGMVIDYTIECISSASLKISSKVFELIYFTVLPSHLLVRLLFESSRKQNKRHGIGKAASATYIP